MEKRLSLSHILITLLLIASTVWLCPKSDGEAHEQFLNPPPEYLEYFAFGFRESLADSLWLRWIQDNDNCQTFAGQAPAMPIDSQKNIFANPRRKFCDNSWSFKMLDAITRLSPEFKMPYISGAITLSVLTEDYEGAKVIFDRGISVFPQDWELLYRAAYHYLFDRNDLPRAAELLVRAGNSGAPNWLIALASRLYSKTGQIELGLETMEKYRATVKDNPKAIEDIDRRIADLKMKLQKEKAP